MTIKNTSSPSKIAWEKRYADDSGVEFAVRYNADNVSYNGANGFIEFESVDTLRFPLEELEWLIDCLSSLKNELE